MTLKRRGHDVQLLTAAPFHERVERAGLGVIEAGNKEQYEEVIQNPDLWHPRKGAGLILRQFGNAWPLIYECLLEHTRPDTVLVTSTLGMAARLIQEKLGTRLASVHLQPSSLLSATDPGALAAMPWAKRLPWWAARGLIASIDRGMSLLLCPRLNEFRATIALPPVRSISQWMNSPERVICAWRSRPTPPLLQQTGRCSDTIPLAAALMPATRFSPGTTCRSWSRNGRSRSAAKLPLQRRSSLTSGSETVFNSLCSDITTLHTSSSLWSSANASAGKTIGPVHWQSPIVVNGWVYCSDQNGNLTAYGLP